MITEAKMKQRMDHIYQVWGTREDEIQAGGILARTEPCWKGNMLRPGLFDGELE